LVFFGEDGGWAGPVDVDLGVGEVDAEVVAGGVDVGAFVGDVGEIGEDAKAVGEALGDEHLLVVFVGEYDGGPAAEGFGVAADVHGDVKDFAPDDVNEFGLRVFELIMQAADDVAGGAGVVVLNEGFLQSDFVVFMQVEGFEEKATVVTENFGLDDDDAGQ